ncbi:winged helix-turn-helix domain-containing protein [Treponema phagedenis]|uniref:LysR family transcriptional regulator n=1 Tax=Treponema phagedenis TaxID=162 RepID=A0AAE6IV43_TREPH|nr:LysR family transcriptional regulator [Treponema phagedenis]QEJ98889.1 LysR family transcriptional regulator [Treponema phagedenis]
MKNKFNHYIKITLVNENKFFGPSVYDLLTLIKKEGAIKTAAQKMGLSYSKALKMIGNMEKELGSKIVDRKSGGITGGESTLTEYAEQFLENYKKFEEEVKSYSEKIFNKYF